MYNFSPNKIPSDPSGDYFVGGIGMYRNILIIRTTSIHVDFMTANVNFMYRKVQ